MKILTATVAALTAMIPLALADAPRMGEGSSQPVVLNDKQLDQVVGGHLCDNAGPIVNGLFEGQTVFTVPEGDGSIHCALKPNGGIPIVIFTGHNGTGQIIIIGDQGTSR